MRRHLTVLGPVVLAAVLGFVQRPGEVVADTKVDLYVDPQRFLADVLRVWSPTADLGHVFGAQYGGYAWPMAPWFAGGDALGIPTWLVHRLWLATLLAVAALGVVRLLQAMAGRDRAVLAASAAVLYVANPYVTVLANRTSISLLSYAALPWLLLVIHRGVRVPRGWLWPAVFALVLTTTGGGVNAAVTGWLLLGPLLLLVYERVWGGIGAGALWPFVWRLGVVNVAVQLWWVIPVLVQARSAPSFLAFSEQPGTIWSTTSLTESLRLMGFWTSYVGVGAGGELRPFASHATVLLFTLPVVLAGLVTPALSLVAFIETRRWRYAPFFLLLTLLGLLVMAAGWPEGAPLRRVLTGAYYRVESIQFLRTTYKAGALTALGLACLGGAAFAWVWARSARTRRPAGSRVALSVAVAALVALSAWPLVTGRAPERQLVFDVPRYWHDVAADLDRRGENSRALVLPGQLFAYYRWGGTVDPILPTLTRHPVATRWIVPFADRRATELHWTVHGLVAQGRLRPGQLRPLLDVLAVGDAVVAADGDRGRSGEPPAGDVARLLAGPGELGGGKPYGPRLGARPAAGSLDPVLRVPAVRRVPLSTGGLVRVLPRGPLTVVDGSGGGVVALAGFGALDPARPLAYAPDLAEEEVRRSAAAGAAFVISDTNRRRAFVAAHLRGGSGPTLRSSEDPSADGALLDPWAGDARTETVAVLRGVRSVTAPASPQVTQFPERRPFAAIDGDPRTAWLADRVLERPRHRLTVRFTAPRDVPYIDVLPYGDSRGEVREIEVAGRRVDVGEGWTRVPLGLRDAASVTVRIARVGGKPEEASAGAGGLREVRIPGVRATETFRPPVVLEEALRGADLARSSLTYLLERTTADDPLRRGRFVGPRGAALLRDAQDPEPRLRREIRPPAARRWGAEAFATAGLETADDELDRLVLGRAPALRVTSASRFENRPRHRGSGAFDGSRERAWIGQWIPGRPAWLAWRSAQRRTVRRLVLEPSRERVRRPTRVVLTVDGRRGPALDVGAGGAVALPEPVRGRSFRLDVVAARFPGGTPGRVRMRRAVGVGEVRGAGVGPVPARRGGAVAVPCGAAAFTAGGRRVGLGGRTSLSAFEAGEPVRLRACGDELALAAATVSVEGAEATPLRVDALRLTSAAEEPDPVGAVGGRVLDAGSGRPGERHGVRVALDRPSWLVLGESFDAQWRATCDGRDLGAPRPMQGYANAWPVDADCRDVRFAYSPQRAVDAGYAISGLAVIGCLLVLLVARRRRRRGARTVAAAPPGAFPEPPAPRPWAARRALVVGFAFAVVFGLAFGLRAGAVAGPVVAFVLWRGLTDRALARIAGVLLVLAVPVAYVVAAIIDDEGPRGYDSGFALARIGAHWIALAGLALLALVLWRTLRAGRRARLSSRAP